MSAVTRAYRLIHEASPYPNWPSPERPYVIICYSGGFSNATPCIKKSDGYTFPYSSRFGEYVKETPKLPGRWTYHVGGTRSGFRRILPALIEYRDAANIIHALSLGKHKLTEDDVARITTPELKQKLVEAACLNAAK